MDGPGRLRTARRAFREFGLSVKLPELAAETTLPFPTVQGCVDGSETAWITIPEGDEEVDAPAPTVTLTDADGGHGGATDDSTEAAEAAEGDASTEAAADAAGAALSEPSDDRLDPLALGALAVALLALGMGIGAWFTARRSD